MSIYDYLWGFCVKGKPENHILNARSINIYKGYMRFLCNCFRSHCRRESVGIAVRGYIKHSSSSSSFFINHTHLLAGY
jgi:hypothetical protein